LEYRGRALENLAMTPAQQAFWRDRHVLVTGHTGFKGSWLALMLQRLGAKVSGIALAPEAGLSTFAALGPWPTLDHHTFDIRDAERLRDTLWTLKPQVVFHLAAQALVRRGYQDPEETFSTNVQGTINLLQGLRRLPDVEVILVVTSDKVYRNDGTGRSFREQDPLGGSDPYSASKAACEVIVESFSHSFGSELAPLATARAGNVIGGGDYAADRIVPDIVRSVKQGTTLVLRYPDATRPWQHVLDVSTGYLLYAQALAEHRQNLPRSLNFGPPAGSSLPVRAIVEAFGAALGRTVEWVLNSDPLPEQPSLALDATLAGQVLGWQPRRTVQQTVAETVRWHHSEQSGAAMRPISFAVIDEEIAT
jgi:CDP-glucose 4,6-dehydratase